MPVSPFCYGVSLLNLNSRKKGALIIKGFTGEPRNPSVQERQNLESTVEGACVFRIMFDVHHIRICSCFGTEYPRAHMYYVVAPSLGFVIMLW